MTQKYFKVRNGLTIDGTTSGSSNFANPATGSDVDYVLPGSQGASNTVLTNDGSGNLSWALPGGGGSTFGNITVGVETDNTISTTTGNLVLNSVSGTITMNSNGTLGYTLSPISGFNPNSTFTGNIIKGVIRDATTQAAGDMWSMINGAANPVRGLSIDNTDNTAKRPGIALRGYSNNRPFIIGEQNRGTVATPLATASGNNLLEIAASGWNGTQWVTDAITVAPISISLQAAEAFTSPAGVNTANGSRLRVDAQPTGVTATAVSRSAIINHTPTTATYRSDAWTFATREVAAGGTNTTQLTLDSSGNAVLTGNLRVNGNNIQSSTGATVMTMTTNDAVFADAVQVNGSLRARQGLTYDMLATSTGSGENTLTLLKDTNTTAIEQPVINFISYRSTAGTYSPTQSGDKLGQFKFNGNTSSTTTPTVGTNPAVSITGIATELWTATNTGAKLLVAAVKNGGTAQVNIIDHSPTAAVYKADTFTIEDSTGADYLVLNSTSATFTQDVSVPLLTVDSRSSIETTTLTTTATTTVPLVTTTRNVMKCVVYIVEGANVHTVEALVLRVDATTAMLTTYGEMYNTTALATFTADVSGGEVRLLVTPASATSTVFSVVRTSLT